MTFAHVHNGGAFSHSARAGGNIAVTAAGSGDNTEVDLAWVGRNSVPKGIANSAKVVISFSAVLAQGQTLTIGGNFRDATSIAGAGAADFAEAVAPQVVATGGTGGSTETGTFEVDVDLGGAREFFQFQVTPNLSAGATDTAALQSVYMLYGEQRGLGTKSLQNLGSADSI